MDTWCIYHTPNRELLIDYQKIDGGKVLFGDNNTCDLKGIGSIWLPTYDSLIRNAYKCKVCSELKQNMISLGELDRTGYSYKSEMGFLKVTKGYLV